MPCILYYKDTNFSTDIHSVDQIKGALHRHAWLHPACHGIFEHFTKRGLNLFLRVYSENYNHREDLSLTPAPPGCCLLRQIRDLWQSHWWDVLFPAAVTGSPQMGACLMRHCAGQLHSVLFSVPHCAAWPSGYLWGGGWYLGERIVSWSCSLPSLPFWLPTVLLPALCPCWQTLPAGQSYFRVSFSACCTEASLWEFWRAISSIWIHLHCLFSCCSIKPPLLGWGWELFHA